MGCLSKRSAGRFVGTNAQMRALGAALLLGSRLAAADSAGYPTTEVERPVVGPGGMTEADISINLSKVTMRVRQRVAIQAGASGTITELAFERADGSSIEGV